MLRKIIFIFSLAAIMSCSSQQKDITEESETNDMVVMAYYVAEKPYEPEKIPVEKLTHIIFSFTNVIEGEMRFRGEKSGQQLKQLVEQKKRNPQLKVMIACGGWGADGFSDMALTEESRNRFISSAVEFLQEYKLDGLDIDWEYPARVAAKTKYRPEDTKNFTLLMKGLREAMDRVDPDLILTFASAGWKQYYETIELNEVMKYADYMNIMTYDLVIGVSPYTGHHTPLGLISERDIAETPRGKYLAEGKKSMIDNGSNWEPKSTEKIVEFCLKEGVDPGKIVIGAAFYGRAWKGVDPASNGLYQKNGGVYIGWSAYWQIREQFERDSSFHRYWDPIAKAPYLFNARDSIFISYDDTVSVSLKTKYAQSEKLGGIMFWELGNDTKEENGLLDAIYKAKNDEEFSGD